MGARSSGFSPIGNGDCGHALRTFCEAMKIMQPDIVFVDDIPAIVTKSPSVKVSDTEAVVILATLPEDDTTHWEIVLDTAASSAAMRTRSELSVKL